MGGLFRRIGTLWAVMAVFVGTSMLVGHGQPAPAALRQLRLEDCPAPCWVGIYPGQSSIQDTYRQLMAAFGLPHEAVFRAQAEGSQLIAVPLDAGKPLHETYNILIELDILRGIPREIRIPARFGNDSYADKMPRLGDVVNLLGKPTCVLAWGIGIRGWSLIYDRVDGVIEVGMKGARFVHWAQPIYFLSLRQANSHYAVNECLWPGAPLMWGSVRVWR